MSNPFSALISTIANDIGGGPAGGDLFSGVANIITSPLQMQTSLASGLLGTASSVSSGVGSVASTGASLLSSSTIDYLLIGVGIVVLFKTMNKK
jgi:hypothetical protein